MNTTEMMVICREVDRATGKIAVYRIETEVTESLIFKLRLRARLNPELQQAAGRRKAGLNMAKMSMRVILKSGAEFTVKCDKFTLERNGLEQVTGYNISGITENKPVYLDFDEVAAIVRVLSDEADAPPEDGGNEE